MGKNRMFALKMLGVKPAETTPEDMKTSAWRTLLSHRLAIALYTAILSAYRTRLEIGHKRSYL